MGMDEKAKLKKLLNYWVEHNREHSEEFREWADRAKAMGDTEVAGILANIEEVSLAGWRRAVDKCHLDIDYYVNQIWDTGQKLPWDVIDSGVKLEHLKSEQEKGLSE